MHQYAIQLYDTSGTKVAILPEDTNIEIVHSLNSFSTHTLRMPTRDICDLLQLDYIVEIRRRNIALGIDWYTEYVGFHRTPQRTLEENGRRTYTSYGRGLLDLVRRRAVLYYAGNYFNDAADTVITQLVDENAGPGATVPPRLYDGQTVGLTVQASPGDAPNYEGEIAWRNLLDVIQEIGVANSVDFDVVQTDTVAFEFRTYYPRKGSDRTGSANADAVVFSPYLNNVLTASFTYSRTEEVTSLIVLGQGQEDDRENIEVQHSAISDSPWNRIEQTHDARNVEDITALEDEGAIALEEVNAEEQFACTVLQTAQCAYGKHYFVGDLVTLELDNIRRNKKITGASITASDGRETVNITFEDHS